MLFTKEYLHWKCKKLWNLMMGKHIILRQWVEWTRYLHSRLKEVPLSDIWFPCCWFLATPMPQFLITYLVFLVPLCTCSFLHVPLDLGQSYLLLTYFTTTSRYGSEKIDNNEGKSIFLFFYYFITSTVYL